MNIKNNMLRYENDLSPYAEKSINAIHFNPNNDDFRPNFFRDIDRIIHSLSYTRYNDKTQVFSNNNNDHITKRIIHVQLVSKIARTIGRALKLNEDLIEAMSLGHDLGHVPFGHVGESILNKLSQEHNEGIFLHNIESVRTLLYIENNGKGKNITVQTLDGIMCHNGEKLLQKYTYKKKTKEEFLDDYNKSYKDKKFAGNLIPMTLEACVVRISDIIAYVGRDYEDAEAINTIKIDIPKSISNILGNNNKEIVNTLIKDVIENSLNKNYIMLSDEKFEALNNLIKFNYVNIYNKANSKNQLEEYNFMFKVVFEKNLYILNNNLTNYSIFTNYLNNMDNIYKTNTNERIVIDYIAGMTDNYFINEFNTLKKI